MYHNQFALYGKTQYCIEIINIYMFTNSGKPVRFADVIKCIVSMQWHWCSQVLFHSAVLNNPTDCNNALDIF